MSPASCTTFAATGSGPATGSTGSTGGGGTGGGGTGGGGGSNSSMQVVDLGGGAGQDIDISNSTSTSYQFPSTQGTISVQVGTDGSVTLIGSSGASDLQMQTNPTPMSGVETINQSLKITGVTSLSVKMIDGKIFVSLRLDPNNVTVTYNDITPDGETRPKENYAFKFIVAGYPPVIIPNGKTLSLRQNREALQARMADSFTATGAMYFHSRSDITVRFGSSLLPAPVSP